MFATIKHLIPEPRQADQPRRYVGRHRRAESAEIVPATPAPAAPVVIEAPEKEKETAAV